MKKAIKVVALLTVLMTVAAGAWAYDDAQHVKMAPNGKGDLLIFPLYFSANGGWQTKISVINTAVGPGEWSTVAKVVIRTNYYSQEVLDFLLYLTPADVWTATITNDGTNTWLESTDDSMLAPNGQFASATNPVKIVIPNPKNCTSGSNKYNVDDSSQFGYIEIIEGWYGDVSNAAYNGAYQTGESRVRPVSKSFLYRVYSTMFNTIEPRSGNAGAGVPTDRTLNILSGYMEFQNSLVSGYTSSMQALVFADWDATTAPTSSLVTGITLPSRNTLGELEAALAKTNIAMPYAHQSSDFTVHVMTFPTKVSNFDIASGDNYCRYIEGRADGYGLVAPYWNDPDVPGASTYTTNYACPVYGFSNFDLSEGGASGPYSGQGTTNSMCREVNLLLSHNGFRTSGTGSIYTEGWTNYTFTRQGPTLFTVGAGVDAGTLNNHTYYGVPVIPSVLMFKKGSVSMMEGSYSDGHVYGRDVAGADPNATAIGEIIPATGIPAPGTAPTMGELPPYYDTATWPGTWPMGGYAAGYAWLPEYQYSNILPELGRDTY